MHLAIAPAKPPEALSNNHQQKLYAMAWVADVCKDLGYSAHLDYFLRALIDDGLEESSQFVKLSPQRLVGLGIPFALATALINTAQELHGSSISELPDEIILRECRAHLRARGQQRMLVSMLRVALSRHARQCLASRSLSRCLAAFPDEFSLAGPRNCAKVTWLRKSELKCVSSCLQLPVYDADDWKDRVLMDGVIEPEIEKRHQRGQGPWPLRELAAMLEEEPFKKLVQEALADAGVDDLQSFLRCSSSKVRCTWSEHDDDDVIHLHCPLEVQPPTAPSPKCREVHSKAIVFQTI